MLREYRKARGIKQQDFAAQLGIHGGYLSNIEKGKETPGLRVAVKIERLTGGAVPAVSWVPEDEDAA